MKNVQLLRLLLINLIVISSNSVFSQNSARPPYLNPQLTVEERVDDLVSRMTLDEKIGQMMNTAPAIERLQIPEYNWWNECLHGVARAGRATVFPQAIGLGATWDEDLILRVANVISDEARAKHHDFANKGKRLIYQGLTFWTPNINIFRDPRWGRGQETYGEDPYLTGRLGVQFIKGLQGDDPKYFKTIATVKHFVVHSGPEPQRHYFNAMTNERDFRETYLPQFEMGVKEGKAYSVMCAYNRYNGEACCGSDHLLNNILRNEWDFKGYIVSDCGAISDIYKDHKVVQTPAEAAALAVKSGCDLECATVYQSLKEAVSKNIISEKDIDIAVKRLFIARFKLGMFDPPEMVKYTKIPFTVVESKENQQLALEAARKSIVLLKNDNQTLPLKRNIKTLAVIGPNADNWTMLLGNYNGIPSNPVTPLKGLREKMEPNGTKVLYSEGCELVEGLPSFDLIPAEVLSHNKGKAGLAVEYYNNRDLSGTPLFTTIEKILDANWYEKSPRADMDDDNFGVRWSGEIKPDQSGMYQIGAITTCRTSIFLNDSLIAKTTYHFRDEFSDPRLRKSRYIYLEAGKTYKIRVEAGESYGEAQVHLVWAAPKPNQNQKLRKEALEIARKADAIVMCMGISARLEGEEMDVDVEGFKGGDRTRLDLPDAQQALIKEICALGKPVVLVLLNGSALAINWEKEYVPAIVEAWYPGQAAGPALADVLLGDYNPGGRLPVTFYKSVNDLPAFDDYNMSGRTYRYFKGETLFPFGYGLSYTRFSYSNLKVIDYQMVGDTVRLSVDVKNTGKLAGDEVVQLYLSDLTSPVPAPIRTLKGFKRITLAPGEIKTVLFSLLPNDFSIIDDTNKRVILPGKFEVAVGGCQPDDKTPGNLKAKIELQ